MRLHEKKEERSTQNIVIMYNSMYKVSLASHKWTHKSQTGFVNHTKTNNRSDAQLCCYH